MTLAVLVPMLGRPHRVEPLAESVRATCDARLVFCVTPGDSEVIELAEKFGDDVIEVRKQDRGDYARKINAAYWQTTESLLFLGADDLLFHPGWYEAAAAHLLPGIGVVGTNDLGNPRVMAGAHATHSLVTRAYADVFGTIDQRGMILHEGYAHEFVDDELVATAKKRQAWSFAGDSHVEHLHPNWGKGERDPLYDQQAWRMSTSRALYRRRSRLWK